MTLKIDVTLDYALFGPTDCLAQIYAAETPHQKILSGVLTTQSGMPRSTPAEEGIGERLWVRESNRINWRYTAEVDIDRTVEDIAGLSSDMPHDMPPEVVKYLFPSRYCPSDKFMAFVNTEFGRLQGGAKLVAMNDFVKNNFSYVPGTSDAETSALETFVLRQGVCRDFAHMLITLARAGTIPARIVSVYALGVDPQDFHAVVEVWLQGAWHLVDPTGMAEPENMAGICVGRDATDIAFLTTYGPAELRAQSVNVTRG
ncbi:transglutaminase-like domain-containing protein [Puniceibacterium confluentis]|uniref:transglutaminase-like domain-containing protein n=1 Tax=Puniceibacterium confluentis TaxID=1958944 RepID=UPI0011B6F02F|nr:transglutaminase family protein [Puniceibacterium confluentis]